MGYSHNDEFPKQYSRNLGLWPYSNLEPIIYQPAGGDFKTYSAAKI